MKTILQKLKCLIRFGHTNLGKLTKEQRTEIGLIHWGVSIPEKTYRLRYYSAYEDGECISNKELLSSELVLDLANVKRVLDNLKDTITKLKDCNAYELKELVTKANSQIHYFYQYYELELNAKGKESELNETSSNYSQRDLATN